MDARSSSEFRPGHIPHLLALHERKVLAIENSEVHEAYFREKYLLGGVVAFVVTLFGPPGGEVTAARTGPRLFFRCLRTRRTYDPFQP